MCPPLAAVPGGPSRPGGNIWELEQGLLRLFHTAVPGGILWVLARPGIHAARAVPGNGGGRPGGGCWQGLSPFDLKHVNMVTTSALNLHVPAESQPREGDAGVPGKPAGERNEGGM